MGLGDPRVIWNLYDLSVYVDEIPKGWVIMLGQAERGPVWTPTYLTSSEQFITTFGNTVNWTTDPLSVITALDNGAKIVFIRLVHCTDVSDRSTIDADYASTPISDRGDTALPGVATSGTGPFTFEQAVAGSVIATEVGPFTIVTGSNDKLSIQLGYTGNWATAQDVTLDEGTLAIGDVVDAVNAQTTGLTASAAGGKLKLIANSSDDGIKIASISNNAYSTLGLIVAEYARTEATDTLVVSINATADQTFQLLPLNAETGSFSLTSAQVATQLAALTAATASGAQNVVTITSTATGESASVQVKTSSTATTALGFDTTLHSGSQGTAVEAWRLTLTGPGSYGNNAKFYVYDSPLNSGEAINTRLVLPGGLEEYYSELTNDPLSARYWKTYINEHSTLCRITDVTDPNASPNDWPAVNLLGYTLTGGTDGSQVLSDADYVGDSAAGTGIYCCDRVLMQAIDIMAIGTSSAVVHANFIEWISNRSGFMGHGQVPGDLNPTQVVEFRMGTPPTYTHAAFNSWNYSLMFGRPSVLDAKTNRTTEIPGLAYLAAAIGRTDDAYGVHYSPFGIKRGYCNGVLDIDYNVFEDRAGADLLAEYQVNNLRIIRTTVPTWGQEGAYLWGGWSTQRQASATREFKIVRVLKQYERMLLPVLLGYINDPNHPVTWAEIHRVLEPVFRREAQRYAIYGYFIQSDKDAYFTSGGELKGAVLNTGYDIDQGKYRVRILIQPTRDIFYLISEMGVMRTGEPFSNYSELYSLPGWIRK